MSEAGDRRTVSAIVEMVETYYGLPAGSILSHSRAAAYAQPRMIVMYLVRKEIGLTLERAAAGLDRDHSTVYHGAATVLRSHDLWYLRDVVRGVADFEPKNPSIEAIGERVATFFQLSISQLRQIQGSGRFRRPEVRARRTLILVANQFGMLRIASAYLDMRLSQAQSLVAKPWPEPLLIMNLFNQVRNRHGTQQEHWAILGRRYCLGRGPQKRRSPIPVAD